jgi:hypothetical protein
MRADHISCRIGYLGGRRYQIGKGPSFSLNQLLKKVERLSNQFGVSSEDIVAALIGIKTLDDKGNVKS